MTKSKLPKIDGRSRVPGLDVRISERAKNGIRDMAAQRRVPIHAIVEAAIAAY